MRPIGLIEAEAAPTVEVPTITAYLHALAALCLETSRNPAILGLFVKIVAMAPGTIARLGRERKRIAA